MLKLNLKALVEDNQIFVKNVQWNKCFISINICVQRSGEEGDCFVGTDLTTII